ncbi:hypothetical protein GXP67_34580 [Rhodocytophaga rosea]|uniref:Uncharacterized protein n=1 Tax=Rhodocytophaga rosea TaxID=2704465 RepID=A0A6C0GV36_9BACT|nr:hypothetical protein [Rhodocytophaga rosea]QHT71423.1 hypothetical protein GXP67_34580 [Rhodocytophaga rosea]
MTDTSIIYNEKLPVWIVPVSGWGEEAYERMNAYKQVAELWKLNIEFSSRLGTFNSYKHAPSVAKEIREHNGKAFERYQKEFGENWQQKFMEKVNTIMCEN